MCPYQAEIGSFKVFCVSIIKKKQAKVILEWRGMSDNSIFQINTAAQLSNVENIVEQWSEQKVCNPIVDRPPVLQARIRRNFLS